MLLTATVQATTINDPTDRPTIRKGVNASTNGDTAPVHPGVYQHTYDASAQSNGIDFYKLSIARQFVAMKKMLLVK